MGSDNKHHSIFHATRPFPGVTGRPRNRHKRGRENDGSGSADVEQQNVHRRPDGCMGKQNHGSTDMGCSPDVPHRQVAGMQAIFRDDGETIMLALLAQETSAAEEEGESQAMLFAMLQEQQDKQIAAMTATNKANMVARSRLCTYEDGTILVHTLHCTDWYIKKGGERSAGYG